MVKFPHFVLESFITSFPVIHRLAHQTETEVFEEYLMQRWEDLRDCLGELPSGKDRHQAIALTRLVVQAQNIREQQAVASAFRNHLSDLDKQVCHELVS